MGSLTILISSLPSQVLRNPSVLGKQGQMITLWTGLLPLLISWSSIYTTGTTTCPCGPSLINTHPPPLSRSQNTVN